MLISTEIAKITAMENVSNRTVATICRRVQSTWSRVSCPTILVSAHNDPPAVFVTFFFYDKLLI